MKAQLGLVKAVAFLLLLLSINLVISKSSDAAESAVKLTTNSLGDQMKMSSSSLKIMKQSGPSPSGPGHKSTQSPNLGFPRPYKGLLHFSRIHH